MRGLVVLGYLMRVMRWWSWILLQRAVIELNTYNLFRRHTCGKQIMKARILGIKNTYTHHEFKL